MCGLAGLAFADPRVAPSDAHREEVAAMLATLAPRGPDGERIAPLPGAVLGHRRLAIIDLTERGAQPMPLVCRGGGASPRAHIVFNGEIYNYLELRSDLTARGHRFTTDSDTETILHLYEERALECVSPLRGMFAFALWDASARRLVLARDRMGEKPLFYRVGPEGLAFASEVKALVAMARARGRSVTVAPGAIARYLSLKYVPGPATAIEGVVQLPPASLLAYQDGRATVTRYWSLPLASGTPPRDTVELRRELRATIEEAVRLRLRSDVPLGVFLSGGIDSGIVAAAMARAALEAASPIRSFTVGFGEKDYDELAAAARVARALGADHHEILVRPTPRDTIDLLPELAFRMDQPFADSSALAVHHLAREVRKHVTVALSGDGGDELFLGYDRYRAHRLAGGFARRLGPLSGRASRAAERLLRAVLRVPPSRRNLAGRARRFLEAAGAEPLARNDVWITCLDRDLAASILSEGPCAALSACDPLEAHHRAYAEQTAGAPPGFEQMAAIQRADLSVYLPDDVLRKVDLATMTHSLESRAPLLDHHVVELALRIPHGMNLRGGRGKAILRETFGGDLPPQVAGGRKAGFGLPLDHWLRGELWCHARELLLQPRTLSRGLLNRGGVERLLGEHKDGLANRDDVLWTLVMLEHWFRAMIDGVGLAEPDAARASAARPA